MRARRGLAGRIEQAIGTSKHSRTTTIDDDYDKARCSVRIWPIDGEGEQLVTNVSTFLSEALKLKQTEFGVFTVRSSKDSSFHLGTATFTTNCSPVHNTRNRDLVMSRGPKLAASLIETGSLLVDSGRKNPKAPRPSIQDPPQVRNQLKKEGPSRQELTHSLIS